MCEAPPVMSLLIHKALLLKLVHGPASLEKPWGLEMQDLKTHPNSPESEKVWLLKFKTHWTKVPAHLVWHMGQQFMAKW